MSVPPTKRAPVAVQYFAFKIHSEALAGLDIHSGSRVLVRMGPDFTNGEPVIARTPQGVIPRVARRVRGRLSLEALDSNLPLLILTTKEVEVLGVVCALLS